MRRISFIDAPHQLGEFPEMQLLRAVRERLLRLRVHLDDQPVGADGVGGQRQRDDQVPLAGGVRGVDHDREMGQALENGDRPEIERVARRCLECPDAPLAEDHLVVPLVEYVFGRVEQLVERRHHPPLEQDRLVGALPERLQQLRFPIRKGGLLLTIRPTLTGEGIASIDVSTDGEASWQTVIDSQSPRWTTGREMMIYVPQAEGMENAYIRIAADGDLTSISIPSLKIEQWRHIAISEIPIVPAGESAELSIAGTDEYVIEWRDRYRP